MDPWFLVTTSSAIIVAMITFVYFVRAKPRSEGMIIPERLQIIEYLEVDSQRRLALVRRDMTEHLLLIGGPQDLVVEKDISAAEIILGPDKELPGVTTLVPDFTPKPKPKTSSVHAFAPRAPSQRKATTERDEPKLGTVPDPTGEEAPPPPGKD